MKNKLFIVDHLSECIRIADIEQPHCDCPIPTYRPETADCPGQEQQTNAKTPLTPLTPTWTKYARRPIIHDVILPLSSSPVNPVHPVKNLLSVICNLKSEIAPEVLNAR
jgi:hypothetical protein